MVVTAIIHPKGVGCSEQSPKTVFNAGYAEVTVSQKGTRMASEKGFVEFVVDQMRNAGDITYRKMFGEYAVYCDGKVVALICDNHLFIKPTENGREFFRDVVEAPPYRGAKLYFLIEDQFEDSEWISKLVRITADELPDPKPRKTRKGSKR